MKTIKAFKNSDRKLIENISLINSKPLVRNSLSPNLFILDNNNDLAIYYKRENKKQPKKVGYFNELKKKNLVHKRLKILRINSYMSNSLTESKVKLAKDTFKTFFYGIADKNLIFAKILRPIKGGFFIFCNTGVIGFIHKKELKKLSSPFAKILKKRKNIYSKYLKRAKHDILKLIKYSFFVKVRNVQYKMPYIKRSQKYFIPKNPGYLNFTFQLSTLIPSKKKKINFLYKKNKKLYKKRRKSKNLTKIYAKKKH